MHYFRSDAQRATTAGGLDTGHAPISKRPAVIAKHQFLYTLIKSPVPRRRQISLAPFFAHERLLSLLHCGKNRALALLVLVNSYSQVDLVRIGICLTGRGETQNRIGRQLFQYL